MSNQIQMWTDGLGKVTKLFTFDFEGLPEDKLNWKPSLEVWSIAQIIEHLILINESYFAPITEIKSGTYKLPFTSKIPFLVNQFGNMIFNSVKRDSRRKTKTMSIWQPASSNIADDILKTFSDHQEKMKKVIIECADILEANTIISSPANKYIVYKLEKAFDIIVEHEFRHHAQALEIRSLLKS